MNIACSSCPAKYAIPDEKVRGRKVRITCKRCGAAIIVDGTAVAGADDAPAPAAPVSDRRRQSTIVGGLQAPMNSAPGAPVFERPSAGPRPAAVVVPRAAATGAKAGPASAAKEAPAGAPAEPPWTVAVTDDDHRDMSAAEVAEAFAQGTIDAETFIWRDGMEDWLTPFEIPAIARALEAKGIRAGQAPPAPAAPKQSGWREPGRWDAEAAPGPGVNFDDVTVAMEAPTAQALLDATAGGTGTGVAHPAAAALGLEFGDDESTVVADSSRFEADPLASLADAGAPAKAAPKAPARTSPRPAAGAAAEPAKPAEPARPEAPAEPRDLFGAQREAEAMAAPRARIPSIPPDPGSPQGSLTGARNESSVLFSLDQLVGKPRPAKAAPPAVEKVDEAMLLMGGPGPAAASLDDGENAPPSVARIGGGNIFAGASAVTMAAPDFNAPAAPSAPSHPAPSASAAPPPAAPPAAKGGMGLWMAVVGVAVVGGGAAAFFLLGPQSAPAPEPTPMASPAAPPPAPPAPAPTPVPAAPEPAAPSPPSAAVATAASAAPAAPVPTPAQAAPAAPAAPAPRVAQPASPPQPGAPAAPKAAAAPAPAAAPAAPAAAPAAEGPAFDREAAAQALATAAASAQAECAGQEGTRGGGKVTVTFVNSGRATNALVSGDFAGSPLGGCVARVFRGARVPAFSGDSVRVTKGLRIN